MSMAGSFDVYHKWLGIPPDEQPPHHYRLLGVRLFEDDKGVIKAAVVRQSAFVRSFQIGQYAQQANQLLNELAAAQACLFNPQKKRQYDSELRQRLSSASSVPARAAPAAQAPARPAAQQQPTIPAPAFTVSPPPPPRAVVQRSAKPQSLRSQRKPPPRNLRWRLTAAIGGSLAVAIVLLMFWIARSSVNSVGESENVAEAVSRPAEVDGTEIETSAGPVVPPATQTSQPPASVPPPTVSESPAAAPDAMASPSAKDPAAADLSSENTPARSPDEGLAPNAVDLLSLVDLNRDSIFGGWQRAGRELVSMGGFRRNLLALPYVPPPSYRLDVVVSNDLPERADLIIGFGMEGIPASAVVEQYDRSNVCWSGFEVSKGRQIKDSRTGTFGRLMTTQKPARLTVIVEPHRATITCDDRLLAEFTGDARRLGRAWGGKHLLALGALHGPLRFHKIVLTPLLTAEPEQVADSVQPLSPSQEPEPPPASPSKPTKTNRRPSSKNMTNERHITPELTRAIESMGGKVVSNAWDPRMKLYAIHLKDSSLSDDNIEVINDLADVHELHLSGTAITDAGLAKLKAPVRLTLLDVSRTDVADAVAAFIAPCGKLQRLNVANTLVGDRTIALLESCPDLDFVDLSRCEVTDAGLPALAKHSKLKYLNLNSLHISDVGILSLVSMPSMDFLNLLNTDITDDGLSSLADMPQLSQLNLSQTRVSGHGLSHLSPSSRLRNIWISYAAVDSEGLAALSRLRNLERVGLEGCQADGAALRELAKLQNLRILSISETNVDDSVLEALSALPKLENLNVSHTRITDHGLAHLQRIATLTHLDLDGDAVTDGGLMQLAGLRNLKSVGLDFCTNITDQGKARLRQSLPQTRIP